MRWKLFLSRNCQLQTPLRSSKTFSDETEWEFFFIYALSLGSSYCGWFPCCRRNAGREGITISRLFVKPPPFIKVEQVAGIDVLPASDRMMSERMRRGGRKEFLWADDAMVAVRLPKVDLSGCCCCCSWCFCRCCCFCCCCRCSYCCFCFGCCCRNSYCCCCCC